MQAIYQCLVPEISRFRDTVLRNPPHRHTASDKDMRTAGETETWIGDIQVDKDGVPFEAIEVKAGKPITSDLVLPLPQKFKGYPVNRYYILSTEEYYIADGQQQEIEQYVSQVRQETGCQVIVNGLQKTLWYYLRLTENPELFLDYYTAQVANDLDTKDEHRDLWVKILTQLDMPLSEVIK